MATSISSALADIRRALTLAQVRRAVLLGILLLLFGWSARILFQPLALELGLSARVTGWMYAAFAAASVLGGLTAGHLAVTRRRTALATAFLLVLVALAATSQVVSLGPFVFLPVMGFGYALGMTVLDVFTNEATPSAVRAAIFGVVTCTAGIGIAVGRPLLGILADEHSVSYAAGLWTIVGVPVVGLALLVTRRVPPGQPHHEPAAPPVRSRQSSPAE